MNSTNSFALVTGASTGFGRALSLELASRKKNLLLVSLHNEGLNLLSDQIRKNYNVHVDYLEVDFTQSSAIHSLSNWIKNYNIDILVNNAGIGGTKRFDKCPISYIDDIIQVNIRSLALITHMLTPMLKKNRPAYILNIASLAATLPIAYKTVYPASKSFVYSFSRSLTEELRNYDVFVSVILPGPIKTNKDAITRIEVQGWWTKAGLRSPENLAKIAIDGLLRKRSVIIPGIINKINWFMIKIFPASVWIPRVSKAIEHEIQQMEKAESIPKEKRTYRQIL